MVSATVQPYVVLANIVCFSPFSFYFFLTFPALVLCIVPHSLSFRRLNTSDYGLCTLYSAISVIFHAATHWSGMVRDAYTAHSQFSSSSERFKQKSANESRKKRTAVVCQNCVMSISRLNPSDGLRIVCVNGVPISATNGNSFRLHEGKVYIECCLWILHLEENVLRLRSSIYL